MNQIPISVVDKTGFRNLAEQLDKRYEMPRRKYFSETEIPTLYNETRSVLESQLSRQPYIACTTDLWTSWTVDSYMAVTIHFISDSWEMQSWCLGCAAMHSDNTGEVLEETVIQTWKLESQQIMHPRTSKHLRRSLTTGFLTLVTIYIWQWTSLQAWTVWYHVCPGLERLYVLFLDQTKCQGF